MSFTGGAGVGEEGKEVGGGGEQKRKEGMYTKRAAYQEYANQVRGREHAPTFSLSMNTPTAGAIRALGYAQPTG